VPSVLNRLIVPKARDDRHVSSVDDGSVDELWAAVQDDLDNLLNARNSFADLKEDFVEAGRSVLTYGLPDFSALNLADKRDKDRVRLAVETAIQKFEPRLTGVVVTIAATADTDHSLNLHVDARLVIAPSSTPVGFDIRLPLYGTKYEVKEH